MTMTLLGGYMNSPDGIPTVLGRIPYSGVRPKTLYRPVCPVLELMRFLPADLPDC
ncbi:hypothetical protein THER5_1081 [Bifidobacterium thermacidophilum subsp. thermacidophilum]|uniref:Uncharacterized protein n=1 Tax=Bifidobacterium thermacidophilum subsp. thermacidophilum TaxID=79262 RepID=A0A087E4B8_9BIFI|nr:hypothetical protein THER5_1081 [Bifidobacterium thermacidophilum subsp. thermacidophilum]